LEEGNAFVLERDRRHLFDRRAERCDESVNAGEGFPFAGYNAVLEAVARQAAVGPGMRVLDVGIGTGQNRFPRSCGSALTASCRPTSCTSSAPKGK